MIEYDCVDCTEHIVAIGIDAVPDDRRCVMCRALVEAISDPVQRDAVRRQLREGDIPHESKHTGVYSVSRGR